jgi:SAM-dependent methyltransferase
LVATYDIENSGRDDVDFYLRLAQGLGVRRVVDLACGTGVLATDLAATGIEVIGIDPADAMLDVARHRRGGDAVDWVRGGSGAIPTSAADLILMTGHAAQVFLDDDEWQTVLLDCRRGLVAGGHLAFESRNPEARPWLAWTRERTFTTNTLPAGQEFDSWIEVTGVRPPLVDFQAHVAFRGETERVTTSTLRFRTRTEIATSLDRAGFDVLSVSGDWDGSPARLDCRELIVTARARRAR